MRPAAAQQDNVGRPSLSAAQGWLAAVLLGAAVAGGGLALWAGGAAPGWPAAAALVGGAAIAAYAARRLSRAGHLAAGPVRQAEQQPTGQPPADQPPTEEQPVPPAYVLEAPRLAPAAAQARGPRIVALGGGTGLPALLRGLRHYTDHITAIVTVADDGGSSGRLRRQMGMPPPGDFRNNMAALSDAEELMTRLFQYRFAARELGEGGSELAGHTFGNLFITTMAAVTGSFEEGLAESSRVLAVRGRILPSTLESVVLCAEICRTQPDGVEEWLTVEGESNIPQAGGRIVRVFLRPDNARCYPAVVRAILQADLILAGPGSFFTSVMPNLLVPALRDALCASSAPRLYICNVATQPGETDHYSVSDHMRQLRSHIGPCFHAVLANSSYDPDEAPSTYSQWVTLPPAGEHIDYRLFTGDLVDKRRPTHHDPLKLAARVMEVHDELRAHVASPPP